MFSFLFGPSKRERELSKEISNLKIRILGKDEEIDALTVCLRKKRIELSEYEKSLNEISAKLKQIQKGMDNPPPDGGVTVPFGSFPDNTVAFRGPIYKHDRKTFQLLEVDHSKEGVKAVLKDGSQMWMSYPELDEYNKTGIPPVRDKEVDLPPVEIKKVEAN